MYISCIIAMFVSAYLLYLSSVCEDFLNVGCITSFCVCVCLCVWVHV